MTQNDLESGKNKSESRSTVERFVNPYEEDETEYFLVPPIMDPPPPLNLRFAYLPEGIPITRKELDIIKLTAQFTAVYGINFLRDLMKRVSTNPKFDFLIKPTKTRDSLHYFYARIIRWYANVLMDSQILKFKGSSTAPIINGFFKLLRI